MKKILFLLPLCFLYSSQITIYAQDSQKSETLWVHDTRDTNEPPAFFKREIRADLKQLSTIGISTAYGFSTNLTISPWYDESAGSIHQLNFNDSGIYYRNGNVLESSWKNWHRLVIADLDGHIGIGTHATPDYQLDVNGIIRSKNLLITDGNVGIGTLSPQNKLDVNGTIRAKEIKVESNWADFVFKKGYNLPTLGEVEQHIKDNGTLPGVPSEKEVKTNGINVGEVNALLLQKIEELTLYAIKQQKLIEEMQVEMNELKKQVYE